MIEKDLTLHRVSALPKAEDHLEALDSYTLEQYKGSALLYTFMRALMEQVQRVEDTFLNLQLQRFIPTAFGHTLDLIGEIVGEDRNFRDDTDYRTAILIRAMINSGGGTPEDIIAAIRILYSPRKIEYKEVYPANFSIFIQTRKITSPEVNSGLTNIIELVRGVKPLGVGDFVITCGGDNLFRFSEATSESANFMVKSVEEQNLKVNEVTGVSEFLVEADTTKSSLGSFGFGEFILESQIVIGGGSLAEVLNYV